MLFTTGTLIVGGMVALLVAEWLGQGPAWQQGPWTLLFQAITPRTAGFNTVPMGQLTNASLVVIMVLMFIGASPGSCGGGVKTTTIAVLWSLAI